MPDKSTVRTSLAPQIDYASPDPSSEEEPMSGEDGNLFRRAKMQIWNMSMLPLIAGQIIEVSRIGQRWVYTGSHEVFATVESTDIEPDTRGDVKFHVFGIDETEGSTTFDFDSTNPFIPNASSFLIKAWNPWSDAIPANSKCILGDVSGRVTILGWEC